MKIMAAERAQRSAVIWLDNLIENYLGVARQYTD
jgi:hypothetical protein